MWIGKFTRIVATTISGSCDLRRAFANSRSLLHWGGWLYTREKATAALSITNNDSVIAVTTATSHRPFIECKPSENRFYREHRLLLFFLFFIFLFSACSSFSCSCTHSDERACPVLLSAAASLQIFKRYIDENLFYPRSRNRVQELLLFFINHQRAFASSYKLSAYSRDSPSQRMSGIAHVLFSLDRRKKNLLLC